MKPDTHLPATITEAGRLLRNGLLTSEALTKQYLQRIKTNPKLNAFITITEELALETAAALDAELKSGKDRGLLHGIPIALKDNIDTAGIKTSVGSQLFQNRLPLEDATIVRRLQAAGVVLLGKTNMDEFAATISGRNEFYGDTRNVWHLSHSSGGSSSGTACAVAANLCLGGIGTDTGGSIRVPASWSGIVGLRPTHGLVSLAGVYPRAPSFDVAGPLASCVDDIAILLDVIAGYDPRDRYSVSPQNQGSYADYLKKGVSDLRLGLVRNYSFKGVEPEVANAFQAAINTLSKLGANILKVESPFLSSHFNNSTYSNIALYEFNQVLGKQYRAACDPNIFSPTVHSNLEKGMKIPYAAYEKAQRIRRSQIVHIKEIFKQVDALVTPTTPRVAPLLTADEKVYQGTRQFMLPFSFTGVPTISVPCGFSTEGLPIGLQIIGNHFEEALILRIAAAARDG
jgi:aspartyl-tRNA(Asn)/glutamyl-tRNA(Gln) amidotransferase subunit A